MDILFSPCIPSKSLAHGNRITSTRLPKPGHGLPVLRRGNVGRPSSEAKEDITECTKFGDVNGERSEGFSRFYSAS